MRSASVAPMGCLKLIVTGSLVTGPLYVSSVVGGGAADWREAPASAAARSGYGSENVPFTRWPVAVALGSATVSAASPAVEITLAVVLAV